MLMSPQKNQATIDFEKNHEDLRRIIENARYIASKNKTLESIADFEKLVDLYNGFGKEEGAEPAFLLTKKIDY